MSSKHDYSNSEINKSSHSKVGLKTAETYLLKSVEA